MYLWILLFVLGFAVALYFAWQNREVSDDEVTIPRRNTPNQAADVEMADELDAQDLRTDEVEQHLRQDLQSGHTEQEVAEELSFEDAVRQIHEEQGLGKMGEVIKEPLSPRREKEPQDLNFRKIPIPRHTANDITLEMEMIELGIDDSRVPIAKVDEELSGAEAVLTPNIDKHIEEGQNVMENEAMLKRDDLETAEELEPVFSESQSSLVVVLDPKTPADHVIHIGEKEERIPGHEMKIEMELSPRLTALNKDPYWTYLYWVLPPQIPEGNWELKVKNLTIGRDYFQGIDPQAGRWYIHLNQPEHRFNFELGVWSATGEFQTILSSNEIQAPPHKPSDQIDADWATIEELYQGKFITLRGLPGDGLDAQSLFRAEGSPEFVMSRAEGSPEFVMSRSKEQQH